jgi:hypothetical protein
MEPAPALSGAPASAPSSAGALARDLPTCSPPEAVVFGWGALRAPSESAPTSRFWCPRCAHARSNLPLLQGTRETHALGPLTRPSPPLSLFLSLSLLPQASPRMAS